MKADFPCILSLKLNWDCGASITFAYQSCLLPSYFIRGIFFFFFSSLEVFWFCGNCYHYYTTSLNEAWTKALRRFKSYLRCAGDSRWWGSLTMVLAVNKSKCLSPVNHTKKQFIIIILYFRVFHSHNYFTDFFLIFRVFCYRNYFIMRFSLFSFFFFFSNQNEIA